MKGTDLINDLNKRVCIYGRSGTGKTSLLGKVLEVDSMCPLYTFDFDLRLNSLLATIPLDRIQAQLEYDRYRDGSKPGSAFTDAEAKLRQLEQDIAQGKGPKTVAVDSLTFMEKSIMGRALLLDGKQPTFPPQLQHYKTTIAQIEDFISKLCALPINVIVTAHEDIDKDELTGTMVRGISVTGKKLPSLLLGYFNEVWYAEVQNTPNKATEFKIRTRPTSLISARTTYPNDLAELETQDIWKKLAELDKTRTNFQALQLGIKS